MPPAAANPTPIVIHQPKCGPSPPPLLSSSTAATAADGGEPPNPGGRGVEGWAETGCYFGWSGDDLKLSGWVPVGLLKSAGAGGAATGATATGAAAGASAAGASDTVATAMLPETGTVRVVLPDGCDVRVVENDRRGEEGCGAGDDADDAAAEDDAPAKRRRI
jgi:hypothetical protein